MKNYNQDFLKKLDFVLLVSLPVVAITIALLFRTNFLVSTLLFFGLPSIWFSFRTPSVIRRTALFSLVVTPPFMLVMDYIITHDYGWWDSTIFSSRIFGILPYEDFIWAFLQAYVVVIFYEHFLEKGRHLPVSRMFRYLVYIVIVMTLTFFTVMTAKPSLLYIPYAYFWVMIFFGVLPITGFLWSFPRLLGKFIKTAAYFFYLHVLFEYTALELGDWVFPGHNYIGIINFFGHVVPYEEIISWWLLLAIAILTYYEFFDDDRQ